MRIAIIYHSSTGNTEAMANQIGEGARAKGAEVDLFPISQFDSSLLDEYDRLIFGSPASGQEELDELEFLPYYDSLEAHFEGREIALFGSYGWGDGQWMESWRERLDQSGAIEIAEGLSLQEDSLFESNACFEFGSLIATIGE